MTHFHGAGFIRIAVVTNTCLSIARSAILSVTVFYSLLLYTREILQRKRWKLNFNNQFLSDVTADLHVINKIAM